MGVLLAEKRWLQLIGVSLPEGLKGLVIAAMVVMCMNVCAGEMERGCKVFP